MASLVNTFKLTVASFALASVLAAVSAGVGQDGSENCAWTSRNTKRDLKIRCNLRTIDDDFNIKNFSIDGIKQATDLEIQCSDVLFFQSFLHAKSFQSLVNLENITIKYCKMTNIPGGTFMRLNAMKTLTVRSHNNDWSAMALELSPDSLTGMPYLKRLDLGQNNIWNLPERLLCPLPALRHLNLTDNRLENVSGTDAPNGCGENLVTLDLSGNNITSLPESGLDGLKSLRELYLQYNGISVLTGGSLQGLDSMKILNVASNHLEAISSDVFNETLRLTVLNLQNNSINILPPGLFSNLHRLRILDLSFNLLTSEWIVGETFQNLGRLVSLNLSNNRLSQVSTGIFGDLTALQLLDMSYNQLLVIGDMTFSFLHNLRELELSYNMLVEVESQSLTGLFELTSLSIDHNNISFIASDSFQNCTSLQVLRLDHNFIEFFPKAIGNIESLHTLRISHNKISVVTKEELTISAVLQHLDMSYNLLSNLCQLCLERLSNLEILDLSHNELASILQGIFDKNTKLQFLHLDGNKLKDIGGLFASLENLIGLNVSDNLITWFDYAIIPNQLQHLDIHSNQISEIGNHFSLESKLNLRSLDVSDNQLEFLSGNLVPDRIELFVANNNNISRIDTGTFISKYDLSMVNLQENFLNTLDLNSISLPHLSEGRSLPELYIGGNPIVCDCNMGWMHHIHEKTLVQEHPRIMDLDKLMCTLPQTALEGKTIPFLETHHSQFLCSYTSHCFDLCQCCDFIACDCQMICPQSCSCYHDDSWDTNIVDCSSRSHTQMPDDIPMDATAVYMDNNDMPILDAHHLIGRKNLQALYINGSGVQMIQNRTFHGLSALRELHLHDNMLTELKGHEFDYLEELRELYLQNNKLNVIAKSTFTELKFLEILRLDNNLLFDFPVWHLKLNLALRHVAMGVNTWSCECKYMVNFKNWLIIEKGIVHDANSIFCVSVSTGKPDHYVLGKSYHCEKLVATSVVQEKLEGNFFQPVLITLAIFFFMLVAGFLFVFRVSLQRRMFRKYALSYSPSELTPLEVNDRTIVYDAFIGYSELDAPFVTEVFTEELENNDPAHKLCLVYRDYRTMGNYVGDFIIHSIDASQKVVLILTKNFVHHEWCKYSLRIAYLEALKKHKNRVIVVFCGEVSKDEMDSDLLSIVKRAKKVRYEDKLLWNKLHSSLPRRMEEFPEQYCISDTDCVMQNGANNFYNHMDIPCAQYSQQFYSQCYPSNQPSMNDEQTDFNKTFVSMATPQCVIMNCPYRSTGCNSEMNPQCHSSMHTTGTSTLPPSTLPSVYALHQQLRQQQRSNSLLQRYLTVSTRQQRNLLTGGTMQAFDTYEVTASYYM